MQIEKQLKEQTPQTPIEDAGPKYDELNKVIREFKDKEGSLITILHQAQKIFGFLPKEVQIRIAKSLGIPLAEVYGVISFYSLFTMKKRGKYTIEVCTGTACYVKGCEEVLDKLKQRLAIEPGEVSEDGKFTIETTRCVGACSLAPVVTIGEDTYSKVKSEDIDKILEKY